MGNRISRRIPHSHTESGRSPPVQAAPIVPKPQTPRSALFTAAIKSAKKPLPCQFSRQGGSCNKKFFCSVINKPAFIHYNKRGSLPFGLKWQHRGFPTPGAFPAGDFTKRVKRKNGGQLQKSFSCKTGRKIDGHAQVSFVKSCGRMNKNMKKGGGGHAGFFTGAFF